MIIGNSSLPSINSCWTTLTRPGRMAPYCPSGASSSSLTEAVRTLDRDLLLITDPQADQAAEMTHEPLALVLGVRQIDCLGQHAVEVGR